MIRFLYSMPKPEIHVLATEVEEFLFVAKWLEVRSKAGVIPGEIAIFVRSDGQAKRAVQAVELPKLEYQVLDERVSTSQKHVSISTTYMAEGLEDVLPFRERVDSDSAGDESDLKEVYDLLYEPFKS